MLIQHWSLRCLAFLVLLGLLAGCASRDLATQEPSPGEGLSIERAMILSSAKGALGTPYRLGGNTATGLDCSGLVEMAYRSAGIPVPRTADEQYRSLPALQAARPRDPVFFGDARKVTYRGIYRGNGRTIHS